MFRSALLFLTATAALAQESDLPEVVVTATRTDLNPYLAPHVVETLDANDIIERQARSVPEALRQMSGISVQKTANGQGSPYIRGFTGFRTLALVSPTGFDRRAPYDGPPGTDRGRPWLLDAFTVRRRNPADVPAALHARYEGLVDRVAILCHAEPHRAHPEAWADVIAALRSPQAR